MENIEEIKLQLEELQKERDELVNMIGKFRNINLTYAEKTGRVKMIKWGRDYLGWPAEQKITYLEALASSLNESAATAYEERDAILVDLNKLKSNLNNAEKAYTGQRDINVLSINAANEERQMIIDELQKNKQLLRNTQQELLIAQQKLEKYVSTFGELKG